MLGADAGLSPPDDGADDDEKAAAAIAHRTVAIVDGSRGGEKHGLHARHALAASTSSTRLVRHHVVGGLLRRSRVSLLIRYIHPRR